jgi:hypothetical protein
LPGDRFHRPDLIRLTPGADAEEPSEAIEVELTPKSAARLDGILRAWSWAVIEGKLGHVLYLCSQRTLRNVKRALERTDAADEIEVAELDPGTLSAPPPSCRRWPSATPSPPTLPLPTSQVTPAT